MRRSRSVLGVEAVLWEPGSLESRLREAAQLEPLPLPFACFAPLPRLSPVPREQKSPKTRSEEGAAEALRGQGLGVGDREMSVRLEGGAGGGRTERARERQR